MLAERHNEFQRFSHYSQYDRELASVSLESRKLPDAYFFEFNDGKFVIPGTNTPIEWSMSRATPLDVLEYDAFQDIQKWSSYTNEGLSFWVSPPHQDRTTQPDLPPQGKIIVSELFNVGDKKVFSNRAVLFDGDPHTSLRVANNLQHAFGLKTRYFSDDVVRRNPILIPGDFVIADWLPILESSIAESMQWEMIATGEDWEESQKTLEKVSGYYNVASLLQQRPYDLVGDNPISCPIGINQNSASEVMRLFSVEGKFVKNCGNCGKEINKVIGKGYKCDGCNGVYEGC